MRGRYARRWLVLSLAQAETACCNEGWGGSVCYSVPDVCACVTIVSYYMIVDVSNKSGYQSILRVGTYSHATAAPCECPLLRT